jgi:hypothetical protein
MKSVPSHCRRPAIKVLTALGLVPDIPGPTEYVPTLAISSSSPSCQRRSGSDSPTPDTGGQGGIYRALSTSEARQLTLVLHDKFWPVRTSAKGMMTTSICLAEELHSAGIRWDRRRRVMGLHLRGIWEEGEKLGCGGVAGNDGHRAME